MRPANVASARGHCDDHVPHPYSRLPEIRRLAVMKIFVKREGRDEKWAHEVRCG